MIIGGEGPDGPVSIAALRDSAAETLVAISAELRSPRAWHSATMLPDGRVLILGGRGTDGKPVKSIEIFDPETKRFETLRSEKLTPRSNHTATLLTDGSVLVAGGIDRQGRVLDKLEIWDWENDVALRIPVKLAQARYGHNASLQPDGSVMFRGGIGKSGVVIRDVETYASNEQRMTATEAPGVEAASEVRLEASLPENGASNVPPNKRIALRFSKPVRVDSDSASSLVLSGPAGPEAAKIVPAESGMLVFVTSSKPLLGGSTYTLSLSGLVDLSGSALSPTSITFTTAAPPLPEFTPSEGEDWSPDGDSNGWHSGRGRSPWEALPPLQAEPGVTAVSGQVLTLNGLPLADVTLQINNTSVRTDRTGRFLLTAIDAGHHELVIDGRTASKRRKTYGIFEAGTEVKPGQTNALGYTIWMPRIDTAHEVAIPSPTDSEVVVTTPHIPGLEVHIPPNTVILDINHKPVTRLSITAIPVDRPPFPLPSNVYVPIYFTVQPGGAYVKNAGYYTKGVRLIYPNYRHETPGTRANFWHYDPEGKGWYVYGQGTVTADGKQVVPDPGISIREFTGAMINVEGYVPPANGATPGGETGGDPVDLSTGMFVLHSTDLAISDVLPISVSRTFNPGDSVARGFGIGTVLDLDMYLWSANQYQETDLFLPDGGKIHYPRTSPGIGYGDAVFEHTATPTAFYKSKIYKSADVLGWILKLRDGNKYLFGDNFPLYAVEDLYGNRIWLTRGANFRVTRIASPNGRYIDLTYDTSNRVSQATDNIGRTVTYTYDAGNRLWKVTNPNNEVTEYTYDGSGRMLTIKDARGIVYLTNEYDANGRVISQTQADQTTFQFAYTLDANNKVIQTDVTDPRGHVRQVTFDSTGNTLAETFASGTPEEQTYTYQRQVGTNLVQSITDPLGRRTDFTYDPSGNPTSVTDLAGTGEATTSSFTYEPTFNKVATATDPLNHTISFAYDAHGGRTSATDALNNQATFTYNQVGQPISATNPLGKTTQFNYLGGDLLSVTNPLGQTVGLLVDGVGRLVGATSPLGQRMKTQYEAMNGITRITDPLQGLTQFSYDPNGNLLSVTDARNNTISYMYDDMDRVNNRRDPLLRDTSYLYDENGNVRQVTDRKAQVTTYGYDALDRLSLVTYQDGSTMTFSYDAANRVTSIADSVSGTIAYVYDNYNRATSVTTPQGTVSYSYDAAGRRTSLTVPGQAIINYTYDNANRLIQIAQGASIASFTYDAASRLTSRTTPNGIVTEYTYDDASRTIGINYKKNSVSLGDLTYEYDVAGHLTKVGGTFARTGLPQVLNNATYDAANKQSGFGSQTLAYDQNGNLTTDGVNSYSWNARNQLVGMTGPGLNASFVYDALGRRVVKTVNSATTSYLYDGGNILQEQSGGAASVNTLTGGGLDQFFSRTDSTGSVAPMRDALGSTIALADMAGVVQTQYTYEPFGKTTSSGTPSGNTQNYTGREDDGTGLFYYRTRYYSATLQRFISEDPIGLSGGINQYAYVGNNPISFVDPLGLEKQARRNFHLRHGTVYGFTDGSKIILDRYWLYDFYTGDYLGYINEEGLETDWGMQFLIAAPFAGLVDLGAAAGEAAAESGVQFAQKGVSAAFRHGEFAGKTIEDVAAGIRSGAINPDQLPIQVITRNGITYTVNNRSLMALRQAGVEPTIIKDVTGNALFERQLTQRLAEMGGTGSPNFVPIIRGGSH